jgi:hypothetical protein
MGKNYQSFTWEQLQSQITHICKTLSLDPHMPKISTLEVGVNIVTPFEVTPFLKENIISYKGKPFKTDIKRIGRVFVGYLLRPFSISN